MLVTRFPFDGAVALCGLLILVAPSVATAEAEVTGTITIDGKPLAGGKISFHRDDGQFLGSKVEEGKYKVDRVPPGTLRVTLDGKGVPIEYASEDTSALVVQVVEDGPNRYDFELTTSKRNDTQPDQGGGAFAEGVYLLMFEGHGRKVKLTDGSEAVLGEWLSPSVGVGETLRSVSNDNTRFRVTINKLGPLPPRVASEQTALVVGGHVFHLGGPEKVPADGVVNTWANVHSADAAGALAARYEIEPQLRKHPGHRYEVRWVPAKPVYEPGEAVTLRMELKNTGTDPLRFRFGGKQRGPRNNQFRFIAQAGAGGKGLPDTGDPTNFGGIVVSEVLLPGAVFTAEVDLSRWFKFPEPNTYRVTGMLELPIVAPDSPDGFRPGVWDDLAVGECVVRVVARGR